MALQRASRAGALAFVSFEFRRNCLRNIDRLAVPSYDSLTIVQGGLPVVLDEIDLAILDLLMKDGRIPIEHVAKAVNLSRPAVQQRVRRLEARGIIRGYSVHINWADVGYPVLAHVHGVLNGTCRDTVPALLATNSPGAIITDAYRIAGEFCVMLVVRAASTLALQDMIDALRENGSLSSTHTTIVLSTLREGMVDHEIPTLDTARAQ